MLVRGLRFTGFEKISEDTPTVIRTSFTIKVSSPDSYTFPTQRDYSPELKGSLLIGAPLGAALYTIYRLLKGKDINVLHLLLSSAGGALAGGVIAHLLKGKKFDEKLEKQLDESINNQVTIKGKKIDEVIPEFWLGGTNPSKSLAPYNHTQLTLKFGDTPSFNLKGEYINHSADVPTVSAVYRTWLAHAGHTRLRAAMVYEYAVHNLKQLLPEQTIRGLLGDLTRSAYFKIYEQLTRNLEGRTKQPIEEGIKEVFDKFRDQLVTELRKETLKPGVDHQQINSKIAELVRHFAEPLFYSRIALYSMNFNKGDFRAVPRDLARALEELDPPHEMLGKYYIEPDYPDRSIVISLGNFALFRTKFIRNVLIDTIISQNFESFLSGNPDIRNEVADHFERTFPRANNSEQLVDFMLNKYFPKELRAPFKSLFDDVIIDLSKFEIGKKSSPPSVHTYLNSIYPEFLKETKIPKIAFFSSVLYPSYYHHIELNVKPGQFYKTPTEDEVRVKKIPAPIYGLGSGALLGSLLSLSYLRSSKKVKDEKVHDDIIKEVTKGKREGKEKDHDSSSYKKILMPLLGASVGGLAGLGVGSLIEEFTPPESPYVDDRFLNNQIYNYLASSTLGRVTMGVDPDADFIHPGKFKVFRGQPFNFQPTGDRDSVALGFSDSDSLLQTKEASFIQNTFLLSDGLPYFAYPE